MNRLTKNAYPTVDAGKYPKPEADELLSIQNLVVHYETDNGVVEAVNDVSFTLKRGETFGLIGETGAGKTTVALSILKLLPVPPAHVVDGNIRFEGIDLFAQSEEEMRKIRGNRISMIFQDPMTALDPVQRIGNQIAESIVLHSEGHSKKEAELRALEMLKLVGIPEERFEDYPHQFSGGMKQRVVIAMALTCNPELIIADEPTTALDVTIQAQVLSLMKNLKKQFHTSMLIITHDFGVVADVCDRCAVMYAGEIVESGTLVDVFNHAQHPYTIGLFRSLPSATKGKRLQPISGLMPDPMGLPEYCTFSERCEHATEECRKADPKPVEVSPGHFVKCLRAKVVGES